MFLNAAFRVSAFRVSAFRGSCVLRFRCVSRFAAFRVLRLCISLRFGVLRFAAFHVFCVSGIMLLRLSQLFRSQGLSAFRLRSLRFAAFRVSALCVSQRFAFRRFAFRRFAFRAFHRLRFKTPRFSCVSCFAHVRKSAFRVSRFKTRSLTARRLCFRKRVSRFNAFYKVWSLESRMEGFRD